ncbi:YjbE family putative metal transport protein [Oceanobacillus arenosus]|uniref:YjbE family putative metal transport protein n=1 Tax=Oceanobacillus arenosus TaxID=1229153 RepID=UPI001FE49DC6|nr:YjbE family putative metal transport protein [Oceanobacillus arenosus]
MAGDNAIVIGLIARTLPKKQQKKAILWGTVGAVFIRTFATLIVVWLLEIPGLLLVGGLLLIWIAYKLLTLADDQEENVIGVNTLGVAIRSIIMADMALSIDNVLAVAGASHGSFLMVCLGLMISIPIVIWRSRLFIAFVDRIAIFIYIGGGVIAWTAVKMIIKEPFLQEYLLNRFLYWGLVILIVGGVLLAGRLTNQNSNRT